MDPAATPAIAMMAVSSEEESLEAAGGTYAVVPSEVPNCCRRRIAFSRTSTKANFTRPVAVGGLGPAENTDFVGLIVNRRLIIVGTPVQDVRGVVPFHRPSE